MDPQLIIAGIEALSALVTQGIKVYNDSEAVMTQDDRAALHNALLKAEAATKELRPQVDAALQAASQR